MTHLSDKTLTTVSETSIDERILWIRTTAGPRIGFGHLRRCFTLAGLLRDSWTPIFLLDQEDAQTSKAVTEAGWKFSGIGLQNAWASLPSPEGILVDTRITGGLESFIAAAKTRGIPVISIHDLGLSPIASDIAIDGSIEIASSDNFPNSGRSCCGTEFMILDPIFGDLHQKAKPVSEKIGTIYINLGGGDSGRYFPRILEGLKACGQEIEVIGIPGFIDWGQNDLSRRDWRPLRFRWESEKIEHLLFHSDFAITAGGISVYEALCAGTPAAALSYDALQQRTISSLAASGACIDLGSGDTLDPGSLSEMILSISANATVRKDMSNCGRRLVDGKGAERVAQIIQNTVESRRAIV